MVNSNLLEAWNGQMPRLVSSRSTFRFVKNDLPAPKSDFPFTSNRFGAISMFV